MSHTEIALLACAAVLVFWMVGAYNRLVALRGATSRAWQLVGDILGQRGEAAQALVLALRTPLAQERSALDALLDAEGQVRAAADALRARPLARVPAAALVAAEAAMVSASSRVLALLEQQAELRLQDDVAPHAARLADSRPRLAFARQVFNEAAQTYDAAALQFPTRLLARLYGFGAAGRI